MPGQGPAAGWSWRDRVVVGLVALALFGVAFGPDLGSLHDAFIGIEYVDHYGTQWFYWFAERTLFGGESPLHTDLFFYPWGKDIYAHTGANLLDAYLAVPFRIIFGPVLGYNLFLLVGLGLGGLAFYRLAREFTEDRTAAGVGAALFTSAPYALFEVVEGRPTQALLALPTLFLLFTWRAGARRGLVAPALAGLMLALSGYQYWYYAFFGGMVCLAHGLWRTAWPAPEAGGRVRTLARHGVIALVAVALVLPLALPLALSTADGSNVPGLLDVSQWTLTSTPPVTRDETRVGLMLWQPFGGDAGFFVQDSTGASVFLERVRWVPLALPLLLLVYLWRPGRLTRGPWLAMAAMAFFMAVGPMLLVGRIGVPNPVFIYTIKAVSVLQRLWWPARAFAFLAVLGGLGLAVGLSAFRERFGWKVQAVVVALTTASWVHRLHVEELLPVPVWSAAVPAGYRCLAEGGEGAVIELPYAWTQAHLYYQTVHGRPILGGMIENNPVFTPSELVDLRLDNSFVKYMVAVGRGETDSDEPQAADSEAVRELGYRYVLLQKDAFVVGRDDGSLMDNAIKRRLRHTTRALTKTLGRPVYDDARVAIYAPWGDGSPCTENPPAPELEAVGRPDSRTSDLVVWNPERQCILVGWKEVAADPDLDPRDLLWGGTVEHQRGTSGAEKATSPEGD